jgi:hypothetical protein
MPLLGQLRAQGLRITAAGQRLFVSPRDALSEAAKATIRINKVAILRELETEASERQAAIAAARDAARLDDWRAPLILGRLHLCGNCSRYRFGTDPAALGTCSLHGDGLLPFLPFDCSDFTVSQAPTGPACLPDPDGARARAREFA